MPARVATGGRDRYFDVLRTACIVWVVFYHVFSTQAWLGFWPAMGILFALSSSLMVRSLDRSTFQTLKSRLQRLVPVLWLLGAFVVPAMFLKGWDDKPPLWRLVFWVVPIADPPGSAWAESATEPLWYLRSLVWFILLSPILLILFRWYPKTMMLLSVGVLVLLGYKRIGFGGTGELPSAVIVDGLTFLPCWFLGFAHREGMLKRIPAAAVVTGGLTLAGFGTYWVLTHKIVDGDAPSYDFNLFDMAQGLYSLGIAAILLRFSPKFSWIGNSRFLDRTITIINGRAMVIYLWHNIAIELSYPIGDRFNVWRYGNTAATAICLAIALVLTALGVLAFGWIEDVAAGRRPQLLPKELGKRAAAPAEATAPGERPTSGAPPQQERASQPARATVYGSGSYPQPAPGPYDNGYRQYDGRGYDAGHDRAHNDRPYNDRPYNNRPYSDRGHDDRRYDDGRYDDRGYENHRHDERRAYDGRAYDGRGHDEARGHEARGYERNHDDRRPDERSHDERSQYADERRYDDRPRSAPPAPPRPPVRVSPQQRPAYNERPRGRTYGTPSTDSEETVPSFDPQDRR